MDDVTRNLISLFWRAVLRVFASLVRIKKVEETKKSSWRLENPLSALHINSRKQTRAETVTFRFDFLKGS